jgi:hypothetical protein
MTPFASHLPRQGLLMITPLAVAALALMTACASTPAPSAELAVGRAAVERATGPAAAEAPVEMAAARDKITRANAAYANRDRGRPLQAGPLPHHPACGSAPGGSRS